MQRVTARPPFPASPLDGCDDEDEGGSAVDDGEEAGRVVRGWMEAGWPPGRLARSRSVMFATNKGYGYVPSIQRRSKY